MIHIRTAESEDSAQLASIAEKSLQHSTQKRIWTNIAEKLTEWKSSGMKSPIRINALSFAYPITKLSDMRKSIGTAVWEVFKIHHRRKYNVFISLKIGTVRGLHKVL